MEDKKPIIFLVFIVIIFAVIILLQEKDSLFNPTPRSRLQPGLPAPDFVFPGLDGKMVSLADYKGKVVFLNIWATWCPVCVKKMGGFHSFAEKFEAAGGQVLNISQDNSMGAVRAFYARQGYNFPIYLDNTGQLLDAFNGTGLPTSIFINAQGQEVGRIRGGFDWDSSEAASRVQEYFGLKIAN